MKFSGLTHGAHLPTECAQVCLARSNSVKHPTGVAKDKLHTHWGKIRYADAKLKHLAILKGH